jgi:NADH-quinone oxidoreductase subunit F
MAECTASMAALKAIKQQVNACHAKFRLRLMICGSNDCHLTGSGDVKSALDMALQETGLKDQVQIVETGCIGSCSMGPVMTVFPEEIFYMKLKSEDVPELVESHLIKGVPVQRLMYHDPVTGQAVPRRSEIPFFALQHAFVLHNRGLTDPRRIEDYIWRDGYQAMFKSLTALSPSQIIAEVKDSGLRGRGGGGFPTGMKWEFCASTKSDVKYVLCNADEGDPGAFMDRRIMEDDPHAILEGMVIGARAIDAHQGYIYCRAEYPLAIERLTCAIAQAEAHGLLGRNIMGTGFDFSVDIYQGAGAFVCGEETALMTSIEGKRGTPRPRPPFPAVSGLWGKPSILNNVETWSSVPQIILGGGDAYASIGTETPRGPRYLPLPAKSTISAWWKFPWEPPLERSSLIFQAGSRTTRNSRRPSLGGLQGDAFPQTVSTCPSITKKS